MNDSFNDSSFILSFLLPTLQGTGDSNVLMIQEKQLTLHVLSSLLHFSSHFFFILLSTHKSQLIVVSRKHLLIFLPLILINVLVFRLIYRTGR